VHKSQLVVIAATAVVLGLGLSALFLGTSGTTGPTPTGTARPYVGQAIQGGTTGTTVNCGEGSGIAPTPGAAVAGATVTVPNVVGEALTKGETALACAGFKYTLLSVPGQSAPTGSILDQSPAAGAVMELPSTVHLTVAFG
jgi:hypothetical protein